MKKVLLATDFSEHAMHACMYAMHLFGDKQITYLVVHAYTEPDEGENVMVSIRDVLEKHAKKKLHQVCNQLTEAFPGKQLNLVPYAEYGLLHKVINRVVESEDIDIVVMGTRGGTSVKKMLTGTSAATVEHHVQAPLILVPQNASYHGLERVAFATDYKEIKDPEVLDPLNMLSMLCHCLTVSSLTHANMPLQIFHTTISL